MVDPNMIGEQITDVNLPQCQCEGCDSPEHKESGRCTAEAGAPGTQYCAACAAARANDDSTAA